jgi:hypothetical protein
MTAWAVRGV